MDVVKESETKERKDINERLKMKEKQEEKQKERKTESCSVTNMKEKRWMFPLKTITSPSARSCCHGYGVTLA